MRNIDELKKISIIDEIEKLGRQKDRPRADALFCFHYISTFCFYQVMHVGTIALKRRRKDDDERQNC